MDPIISVPDEKSFDNEGYSQIATQLATQQAARPQQGTSISVEDESDVICILHPSSPASYSTVDRVAQTSPQHILQREYLARADCDETRTYDEGDSEIGSMLPPPRPRRNFDIALRLSSDLRDVSMGFVFGRAKERCDIVIDLAERSNSISGLHFRIYFTPEGIIMLEDTSTNGTYVDNDLLRQKNTPADGQKCHMLNHGSIIEIITRSPEQNVRFIVSIPPRDNAGDQYGQKLAQYLAYVAQVERQALAVRQAKRDGHDLSLPKIPRNPLKGDLPPRGKIGMPVASLTAGSERYTHGMHWNGGQAYSVIGHIGKGAFANVYRLGEKSTGRTVACKELEKRKFMKNGMLDIKINNELEIMKGIHHPHIVDYIDYHDQSQYLYIVMEYVPGGDLSMYLNTVGMMPERSGQLVASQVSSALAYLHASKIVHRDIKPDNILISEQDPIQVKLSDFGLSKVVKDEETFLKTFCGTLLYCAPEVYPDYGRYPRRGVPKQRRRASDLPSKTLPYSSAVDVWSLGAVLFHLLSTKPPYNCTGDDKGASMLENIMMRDLNYTPLQLAGVSEDGINFIRAMMVVSPLERATIGDLLTFPWINKVLEESNLSQISDFQPSQESFLAHRGGRLDEIDEDSEEEEVLEVDEIGERPGTADESSAKAQEYSNAIHPAQGRTEPNRLFGEIDPGAIRSSGVLTHDVRAALQKEYESGWDWPYDFDDVGSWQQSQRQSQQSLSSSASALQRENSSPSLFGAEAQIRRLNMVSGDSVMSDRSYPTAPATPKTPGSPDHSFVASFSLTGSKRSPAFSASDEVTPKRAKVEEGADRRPSLPTVDILRGVQPEEPTRSPTVNSKFIHAYENLDVTGSSSGSTGSQRSLKALPDSKRKQSKLRKSSKEIEATSINSPLLPPNIRYPVIQGAAKEHPPSTPDPAWPSILAHPTLRRQSGNLIEHRSLASSSTSSSAYFNDEDKDPVTYPNLQLPSSAPQLTTFSPTTGSNDSSPAATGNEKDSPAKSPSYHTQAAPSHLPLNPLMPSFPSVPTHTVLGHLRTTPDSCIQVTIIMTSRITMWGREHTNTHIWPDDADLRIPRAAFDIVFWCKAFGDAIEIPPELFWREADHLRASIRTRSSAGISVNDVKLERSQEDRDPFGFLCSGDVVTVKEKAGETIRFVCEFARGESRKPRSEGSRFEVRTRKVKLGPGGWKG